MTYIWVSAGDFFSVRGKTTLYPIPITTARHHKASEENFPPNDLPEDLDEYH
jgi:hypothetical protein